MNSYSNDSNVCGNDGRRQGLNTYFSENVPRVSNMGKKTKGANWTDEETNAFLNLCIEKRIIQRMDGKRCKHIEIYESLEPTMKKMGFPKTGAQMKTKLKHLKELYLKCKRNNNLSSSSRIGFPFYKQMEQLLSRKQSVQATSRYRTDSNDSNIRRVAQEEALKVQDNLRDNEDNAVVQNNTAPSKEKKTGRNSHVKLAENFAEVFMTKQAEEMKKVLNEQMRMFNDLIHTQMEAQRQWEKEMMEKDHQHQTLIMENFIKSLGAMPAAYLDYPSSTQVLRPYQMSPSSLCSPTRSSPFPRISTSADPLSTQTSQNPPHTNVPMPPPSPSNSSSSLSCNDNDK